MIYYFDSPVNVNGYDLEDGSEVCCILIGVLDYNHPQNGKPYFMVFNQSIHLDHLEHHLMCTIQCRENGIKINKTTKYQSKAPDE